MQNKILNQKGDTMEDFILKIPKWEGQIDFSQEVITLVIVIVALVTGVTLCFWGYRYFQTIALVLIGCVCGAIGFKIGESMTPNPVLQMCIFVMFTFLGVCLFYFLSILWATLLNKLKIQAFIQRTLHIIAAVSGALIVGIVTYTQVFKNLIAVVIGTAVLAIGGIWYGIKSIKAKRVFRTYEDLYKMKPLTEEK